MNVCVQVLFLHLIFYPASRLRSLHIYCLITFKKQFSFKSRGSIICNPQIQERQEVQEFKVILAHRDLEVSLYSDILSQTKQTNTQKQARKSLTLRIHRYVDYVFPLVCRGFIRPKSLSNNTNHTCQASTAPLSYIINQPPKAQVSQWVVLKNTEVSIQQSSGAKEKP